MESTYRGILYPARLPTFHRLPPPEPAKHLVQWFWIPEWDIEAGRSSRQQLLAFAASNLVIQQDGIEFSGPTTRISYQDLVGTGWAVGGLLRPAAVPFFTSNPADLRDVSMDIAEPGLQAEIVHAMGRAAPANSAEPPNPASSADPDMPATSESRREQSVAIFTQWLAEHIPEVSAEALMANAMVDAIAGSPEIIRSEDAAAQLSVSTRTLQRLAEKYVGLSPAVLIRRRRLQEAAERVRTHPEMELAAVAAEFGYADQAHLAHDFRRFLGITPSSYRREV